MKKRLLGLSVLAIILIAASLTATPQKDTTPQPKQDPNVIHIPVQKEEDAIQKLKKALGGMDRPQWNDFNKDDQMIIDRKTNTFYIFAITDDSADAFEKESSYMLFNKVKEITIDLHSPGGSLVSEEVIVEQMAILKEHGVKINTIVQPKNACMSACPLIFLAGDNKVAYSNSVFMFHAPYVQFPYNTSEPEIRVVERELRQEREEFGHHLIDACKADPSIALDVLDHEDHFYLASAVDTRCGSSFFTKIIPVIEAPAPDAAPFNFFTIDPSKDKNGKSI